MEFYEGKKLANEKALNDIERNEEIERIIKRLEDAKNLLKIYQKNKCGRLIINLLSKKDE